MLETYRYFLRHLKSLTGLILVGLVFMTLSAAFSGFSIAMLYPVFAKVFSAAADPERPVDLFQGLAAAWDRLLANLRALPQPEVSLGQLREGLQTDVQTALQQADKLQVLNVLIVISALLIFLRTATRYLYKISIVRLELELARRVRNQVFDHLMTLSLAFYSRQKSGDLITRLIHDVERVRVMVITNSAELLFNSMQALVFLALALLVDLKLTLLSVIILPVFATIFQRLTRRLKSYAKRSQLRISEMLGTLMEGLGAIRLIIGYRTQAAESRKFAERTDRYSRAEWRMMRVHAGIAPLSEFLSSAIALSILWFGGRAVLDPGSGLSLGGFMVFLAALLSLLRPVKQIGDAWGDIQRGLASSERVIQILHVAPTVLPPARPVPLPPLREGIRFERVSFRYDEAEVLRAVDLEVPRGQVLAVVGGSGAGKSTLLNLIPRFYDPTEGAVRWDGIDLRDVDPRELSSRLGLVTQDVILFDDSVRYNIAYGLEDVPEDRIVEAARAAHAHEFILQLPKGYDTEVGEKGVRLSGGQKQRIAIARALCRRPEVLLLDEATSSLDAESEALVQAAISNLIRDRTSVVVAHRLTTIQKADRIAVLDGGKITELGTHETLIAKNGRYADLYRLQQF